MNILFQLGMHFWFVLNDSDSDSDDKLNEFRLSLIYENDFLWTSAKFGSFLFFHVILSLQQIYVSDQFFTVSDICYVCYILFNNGNMRSMHTLWDEDSVKRISRSTFWENCTVLIYFNVTWIFFQESIIISTLFEMAQSTMFDWITRTLNKILILLLHKLTS